MEMNNYKRRNVKSKQNQQIATSFTSPVRAHGQHTAYDLQVQSPPNINKISKHCKSYSGWPRSWKRVVNTQFIAMAPKTPITFANIDLEKVIFTLVKIQELERRR